MNEDYCSFEQCVKLKEIGFDWECRQGWVLNGEKKWVFQPNYYYQSLDEEDNIIPNPTMSQAQKWLREKHNIIILVDTYFKNYMEDDYSKAEFEYVMVNMNFNAARKGSSKDGKLFESYEQALSAGVDRALELLK